MSRAANSATKDSTKYSDIYFTKQQIEWIREMFPVRVLPVDATTAEMQRYFGTQLVVAACVAKER